MPLKRSCLECRRRKIKCTRTQPCEYCTKLELRCTYPARKPRPPVEDEDAISGQSAREIFARISNLERLLEQSIQSNRPAGSIDKTHVVNDHHDGFENDGTVQSALTKEKGSRVHEDLIPRKTTSFHGIRGIWEIEGRAFCKIPTSWENPFMQSLNAAFTVPLLGAPNEYQVFLPAPNMIWGLWQAYLDHVDPILRLIHAPTMQKTFTRAISQPASLSADETALFMACLFGAQASSPYHCSAATNFDPARSSHILHQLHCGVQSALAAAEYMRFASIPTLQALVMYLACARQYFDPTLAWSLCGIARQLALVLKLDREPSTDAYSPFECEMRRRLWWHICVLDVRIAERMNLEPALNETSLQVAYPAMLDDNQIYPEMTAIPYGSKPATYDMLYSRLRFELAMLARRVLFSSSFNNANGYPDGSTMESVEALNVLEQGLEEKYFSQTPGEVPMIDLCRASMKMVISKYRLVLRFNSKDEEKGNEATNRQDTVKSALRIMQCVQHLRKIDAQQRIWWLPQEYLEWDAAVVIMREVLSGSEDLSNIIHEVASTINAFFVTWHQSVPSIAARRDRWAYIVTLYQETFERDLPPSIPHGLFPVISNPAQVDATTQNNPPLAITGLNTLASPRFTFDQTTSDQPWTQQNGHFGLAGGASVGQLAAGFMDLQPVFSPVPGYGGPAYLARSGEPQAQEVIAKNTDTNANNPSEHIIDGQFPPFEWDLLSDLD